MIVASRYFLCSGGTIQRVHLELLSSLHLRIRPAFQCTKLRPKTLKESLSFSDITHQLPPAPINNTMTKAASGENHSANLIQVVFCLSLMIAVDAPSICVIVVDSPWVVCPIRFNKTFKTSSRVCLDDSTLVRSATTWWINSSARFVASFACDNVSLFAEAMAEGAAIPVDLISSTQLVVTVSRVCLIVLACCCCISRALCYRLLNLL